MTDPGMLLSLGKIVRVYKDQRKADVFLLGGGLIKKVDVLCPIAGTHEGSAYMPDVVEPKEPSMSPSDSDTYCLVGHIGGDIRKAVVLGMLFPSDFETSFVDIDVNKRLGGSYTAFDADGFEINRPDGSYIRVGASTSRIVDSKTNRGSVPFSRTTGTATGSPHIFIKHSNGVSMDFTPGGGIIVTRVDGTSFDLLNSDTPAGSSPHLLGLT